MGNRWECPLSSIVPETDISLYLIKQHFYVFFMNGGGWRCVGD